MYDENVVNDTLDQVVADSTPETEPSEGTENQSVVEEVANPQDDSGAQSHEENTKFKEFRQAQEKAQREAESIAKEKAEKEAELSRLLSALGGHGFKGKTVEEIEMEFEAQEKGTDLQTLLEQKRKEQADIDAKIKTHPAVIEAEQLKLKIALDEDFRKVKEAYPDIEAESVADLGESFVKLMSTGTVDPITAYEVQMRLNEKNAKETPPPIGAVKSTVPVEKEYYSPEEVDRLTSKDLKDPKVMKRVQNSMEKW